MTDPLTPGDCDLRDFAFMPIEAARLFSSEFHALAGDGAWRAGVTLWLKAWHQVPAASLPDDDVSLTRLAELGRDTKAWKKVRDPALRGWIKCNDGRLYHPVVAEKALEAWLEKLRQRVSSASGNAKRWGSEADISALTASIEEAAEMLTALAPQSKALTKLARRQSRANPTGIPESIPPGSQGTGTGTGTGNSIQSSNEDCASAEKPAAAQPDADKQFWDRAKAYLGPRKASLIGKWCSQYGQPDTAKAITAAQIARAVEPVPYIERALRNGRAEANEVPLC